MFPFLERSHETRLVSIVKMAVKMAVKINLLEKSLDDLEKEITCAVCQEHYEEPKVLPCLHCYCKQCISKLARKAGKAKPFSCPECRQKTTLSDGGVEELKPAFIVNRLKGMYTKLKKALSKQASCEICKNPQANAVGFCQQCDKFACKTCVDHHSVMVAFFEGHQMVPLEKLQSTEVLVPKLRSPPVNKCPVHDDILKVYCFDCNKLICRDCTVKDHRDHNIEFNSVAAKNKKEELLKTSTLLSQLKTTLSKDMKNIQDTELKVKAQGDTITSSIKGHFTALQKILKSREQQLIKEVKAKVGQKVEKLRCQEKSLSESSKKVSSVMGYTEQFLQQSTDDEVMSMHTEISNQISKLLKEQDISKNLPVEEATLEVELGGSDFLRQHCQKNIKIMNKSKVSV